MIARGGLVQGSSRIVTAPLIWNLDTDPWAHLACRVAGSSLTAAEWDEWGPSDTDRYAICPQFELR